MEPTGFWRPGLLRFGGTLMESDIPRSSRCDEIAVSSDRDNVVTG